MSRSPRFVLVLAVAFLSLLPSAAQAAYSDGKTDGDDSRSPIDLASVLRTDAGDKMRFVLTTQQPFKASRLDIDRDRFFLIGFDVDRRTGDATPYERCIFVFFDGRLRWAGTDCRSTFYGAGLASKPAPKKVVFTVSMARLDFFLKDHWWAAFSFWRGTPCAALCGDSIPNRPPLFLRDFTPPKILFSPPLLLTTSHTSSSFPVEFSVTDPKGSGVAEWTLFGRDLSFGSVPDEIASGTSGGARSVPFVATEGRTYMFFVEALDKQGNFKEGPTRRIVVPDDDDTAPGLITSNVTTLDDATAYGGHVTVLDATSSYSFFGSGAGCPRTWLIGPGGGDWTIQITWNVSEQAVVSASTIPDGPRRVLWVNQECSGFRYDVELISGTSVAIDAVATETT